MSVDSLVRLQVQSFDRLKDQLIDTSLSYYLHDENYIINPSKTEYIPILFMNFETFKPDIHTEEVNINNKYPLAVKHSGHQFTHAKDTGKIDFSPNTYLLQFGDKSRLDVQGSKGLLMVEGRVAFCVSIRVDYAKQIFLDTIDLLKTSPFVRLMDEHGLVNNPDIDAIMKHKYVEMLNSNILMEDLQEHMHIFKNTNLLNRVTSLTGGSSDPWGADCEYNQFNLRVTDDDIKDYFESKLFTKLNLPTFSDIEEPDNISQETVNYWIDTGFQPEFPYIPA